MPALVCTNCKAQVDFHLANCPNCRTFVGYPNVRRAEGMHAELEQNYTDALESALARNTSGLVDQLELLFAGSVATINVSPWIVANMSLGNQYLGYHRALE